MGQRLSRGSRIKTLSSSSATNGNGVESNDVREPLVKQTRRVRGVRLFLQQARRSEATSVPQLALSRPPAAGGAALKKLHAHQAQQAGGGAAGAGHLCFHPRASPARCDTLSFKLSVAPPRAAYLRHVEGHHLGDSVLHRRAAVGHQPAGRIGWQHPRLRHLGACEWRGWSHARLLTARRADAHASGLLFLSVGAQHRPRGGQHRGQYHGEQQPAHRRRLGAWLCERDAGECVDARLERVLPALPAGAGCVRVLHQHYQPDGGLWGPDCVFCSDASSSFLLSDARGFPRTGRPRASAARSRTT